MFVCFFDRRTKVWLLGMRLVSGSAVDGLLMKVVNEMRREARDTYAVRGEYKVRL